MASVRLDGMLREYVTKTELSSDATSVGTVLDDLEGRFPRLRFRVRDETGTVRKFVRVFVNGEEISQLAGLGTPIRSTDHIDILHSIQGG
ncbi:MAG TPA: MoaD/ThiS family protein [Thermoplasmata archaeon]|nr:MoaD/ThiS family protein [Thermoplasmata archaeon]